MKLAYLFLFLLFAGYVNSQVTSQMDSTMANQDNIPFQNIDTLFLPDGTGLSYQSTINIENFPQNLQITNENDVFSIVVNMEHSFLGDLNIKVSCPNGQSTTLLQYASSDNTSGEFLGNPIDNDNLSNINGTGAFYSFSNFGLETMNTVAGYIVNSQMMPEQNYKPFQSFNSLIGCPINGLWNLEVSDQLISDNGFIFSWQINFDSLIIPQAYNLGSASVSASGGIPPYSYYWSNGMTSSSINHLAPGTYYVLVKDSLAQNTHDQNSIPNYNLHVSKNKVVIIIDSTIRFFEPSVETLPTITSYCGVNELTVPTAFDNIDGTITGVLNQNFPITESTTVTWTYMNTNGDILIQDQQIVILNIDTSIVQSGDSLISNQDNASYQWIDCLNSNTPIQGSNHQYIQSVPNVEYAVIITKGNCIDTSNCRTLFYIFELTVDTLPVISSYCAINELTVPTAFDNINGTMTSQSIPSFPISESTTISWSFMNNYGDVLVQNQQIIILPIDTSVTQIDDSLLVNQDNATYQWIDCLNSNTPIQGETNNIFVPQLNGEYAVIISIDNCSDTSNCHLISGLNMEDLAMNLNFSIHPNPSSNLVSIKCEEQISKIQLFDLSGELIITSNEKDFYIENLMNGIYIIQINTQNNVYKQKLIKE